MNNNVIIIIFNILVFLFNLIFFINFSFVLLFYLFYYFRYKDRIKKYLLMISIL